MKYILSLLGTFMAISAYTQTYTRFFDAKANDKLVGHIKAQKVVSGEVETYSVESEINVNYVFRVNVTYRVQSVYKQSMLISSSASVYINGHLQNSVTTEWKDDHYEINDSGHTTRLYEQIKFSTAQIYFNEPIGQRTLYSESEGIMKTLVKTADEKYKVKGPSKPENNTLYGYSSEQGLNSIEMNRHLMPTVIAKHVRENKPIEE